MRHVQFTIANIALGPRPLPLRHGTIQLVERDHGLDWEIQLSTLDEERVSYDSHRLALDAITGIEADGKLAMSHFEGDAIFVRGDEKVLVFRGNGPLHGFDPRLLDQQ